MYPTFALRWCFARAFAGIGLIALTGCRVSDSDRIQGAARRLQYRPLEARIYGSTYAPWSKENAGPGTSMTDQNVREFAWLSRSKEPEELQARAALSAGNVRYARRLLEKVTSRSGASAAAWSDYSAALHSVAAADDVFTLATSLGAADHALDLDPTLPEALFNRAVALDAMSLRGSAVAAYRKYLQVDGTTSWRPEVQSRLENLESLARTAEKSRRAIALVAESEDELFINDTAIVFPQESRHWAEGPFLGAWSEHLLNKHSAEAALMLKRCRIIGRALEAQLGDSFLADTVRAIDRSADPAALAQAHVVYERGRVAFARMDLAASISALEEARRRFDANGSPMALLAQVYLAMLSLDTGNAARVPSVLRDLLRHTPEQYRALRAQIQWLDGQSAAISGKTDAAIGLYRSASTAFTALGEKNNAAATRELETRLLAKAGRTAEAWNLRHTTLEWTTDGGGDSRLALTLYGAAHDAIVAGRWDIGHALLNTIIETAPGNERLREEVLAWRVIAAQRAGMFRTAAAELETAHAAKGRSNDLMLVEALLAYPGKALRLLDEQLNATEQQGNEMAISQLLVERARLLRGTGQSFRAHADLQRAVALLERRPSRTSSTTIRDAVLGTPDRAYLLLADSLDAQGKTEGVLDALELYNVRHNSPGSQSFRQIHIPFRTSVPPRTLLITYGVFDNRVVIYANDLLGSTRTAIPVERSRLELLVSAFDQAIARDDRPSFRNASRALVEILVEPIAERAAAADTLIFVRDSAFGNLPFGALVGRNEHYLVEDHAVVVTPSISSYFRAAHITPVTSRALLSVGNSSGGGRAEPLANLAAAKSEAQEIGAMYPSHAILVEEDATKARVLGALPYCDAAHFAVHANAGLGDTMPPHLILSRTTNDEGILTAPEIAALQLDGIRTVVLAGCSTAISSARFRTDNLANAFLAAGVGSVIGTLWSVEDASTRTISIAFHRELRKGLTPAQALRTTQVELIRRGTAPSVWASLQLYGSGK